MATFAQVRELLKARGYRLERVPGSRVCPTDYILYCSRCGSFSVAHASTLKLILHAADAHDAERGDSPLPVPRLVL